MPKTLKKTQARYKSRGGAGIPKTVESMGRIITKAFQVLNEEYILASKCYESIWNKKFLIVALYYLTFYICPFIIIITSFIYLSDIITSFIQYQQADFYEDILKYKDATQTKKIILGNYISAFTFAFLAISIVYFVGLIVLFTFKYKISDTNCTHFTNKISNDFMPSFMFFVIVSIILIIDFATYHKFYNNVGAKIDAFNAKIEMYISSTDESYAKSLEIGTKSLGEIINSNTTAALSTYVNSQLSKITPNNIEITKNTTNYKNIVNAWVTYNIIKTIDSNGYHTKKNKTGDNTFFNDTNNLFLSINKTHNKLINVNSNDFFVMSTMKSCSATDKSNNPILDYALQDCEDIHNDIDDIILSIKHEIDNTTSSKIVFMIFMIPLIIITLIYTFVPSDTQHSTDASTKETASVSR